jgi:hypothetical protein
MASICRGNFPFCCEEYEQGKSLENIESKTKSSLNYSFLYTGLQYTVH